MVRTVNPMKASALKLPGRPDRKKPPKKAPPVRISVRRLMHSIAKEEQALAELVAAEARKTEKLAKGMIQPFSPEEVIAFQRAVAEVIKSTVLKEKVLLEKLRLLLAVVKALKKDG